MLIALAPYIGVLAGVVCAWVYLKRSTMPVAASGWRDLWVRGGDCPGEFCGGRTYMVSASSHSTLWRCKECRETWILSSIPGE